MIFVTVGAQMPFDRLIRHVDDWAGRSDRDDIFAQIGPTDYQPRHLKASPFLTPPEFDRCMAEASGVVSHAGMGTIIRALEIGKPILVFPRRGELGETRNDHQVATARHFASTGRILAAFSEAELVEQLERLHEQPPAPRIDGHAQESLLRRIREFALGGS